MIGEVGFALKRVKHTRFFVQKQFCGNSRTAEFVEIAARDHESENTLLRGCDDGH